jgi:hypothetical protein
MALYPDIERLTGRQAQNRLARLVRRNLGKQFVLFPIDALEVLLEPELCPPYRLELAFLPRVSTQ